MSGKRCIYLEIPVWKRVFLHLLSLPWVKACPDTLIMVHGEKSCSDPALRLRNSFFQLLGGLPANTLATAQWLLSTQYSLLSHMKDAAFQAFLLWWAPPGKVSISEAVCSGAWAKTGPFAGALVWEVIQSGLEGEVLEWVSVLLSSSTLYHLLIVSVMSQSLQNVIPWGREKRSCILECIHMSSSSGSQGKL
jgi:hypothetical protein